MLCPSRLTWKSIGCILILAFPSCHTQHTYGLSDDVSSYGVNVPFVDGGCKEEKLSDQTQLHKALHIDDDVPSYGVDISFPMHANRPSTNYPWLPHNVNPEEKSTPPELEGVSVQPLGDRASVYDEYIQGCRDYWGHQGSLCDDCERDRIAHNKKQPRCMVNYTDIGYKKMKTPDHVYKMILDFWESNQGNKTNEDHFEGDTFTNYWESRSVLMNLHDSELKGGGGHLVNTIYESLKVIIQEWTGQNLIPSSLYGIREYREEAVLSPHVDRNPLINSCIINVAQDVDEPWPLEVIGHDGIARNITMEPGDMVLYESHSIIHGRPFPLKGKYYANAFIHFEPDPSMKHEDGSILPPYIIKGSDEARSWKHEYRRKTLRKMARVEEEKDDRQHEVHLAARENDLIRLKKLCEIEEGILHREDNNGWQPIHEAARAGNVEVLHYIIEQGGDLNHIHQGDGPSPLKIAKNHLSKGHPAIDLLSQHTRLYHRRNLTGNSRRKKV